ncbi:type VI secretion system protein ImpF [Pseudoduganella lurida]|uniref:Type VI secretion system protein ImpF n=1 Tax=Pseudoduganella lurida TaxID=1036180 RepID=A0A562R996_9BURK|nr:type VI secretion system baseplate subunit TssE [Pseudoduganella lurida]TWI65473.1 type VI secretion system protein ImpF [Pseudoduganella lurida]
MRESGHITFTSSVWDRLMSPASDSAIATLSLQQYRRAITRDLENLLNTRSAVPDAALAGQPHCRRSIASFGLADFAELSLSSSADRKELCDRLEAAIARHEPRLKQVRAQLVHEPGVVNHVSFVITGRLTALASSTPLRFDVVLQPSTLHYSIR